MLLWFYGKVRFCIEYEAVEKGLQVAKVNPRGTSSICPRCDGRLIEVGHRVLVCKRCRFTGNRDVIAAINMYRRYVLGHSRWDPWGGPESPQAQ